MTEGRQPTPNNHAGLIWSIADLLRGDYKRSEYQRVILPLVLLRRLDCVLEPTKRQVLDRLARLTVENVGPILRTITDTDAYNTSRLTLRTILADPAQVAGNLRAWIAAFDPETRDVIEKFDSYARTSAASSSMLLVNASTYIWRLSGVRSVRARSRAMACSGFAIRALVIRYSRSVVIIADPHKSIRTMPLATPYFC